METVAAQPDSSSSLCHDSSLSVARKSLDLQGQAAGNASREEVQHAELSGATCRQDLSCHCWPFTFSNERSEGETRRASNARRAQQEVRTATQVTKGI